MTNLFDRAAKLHEELKQIPSDVTLHSARAGDFVITAGELAEMIQEVSHLPISIHDIHEQEIISIDRILATCGSFLTANLRKILKDEREKRARLRNHIEKFAEESPT